MSLKKILLVAETINNKIAPVTLELTGVAASLSPDIISDAAPNTATETAVETFLVVAGSNIQKPAEHLARQTGLNVYVTEHPALQYPHPEALAEIVGALALEMEVQYVCFPHTACGCQAAAKTAIKTGGTCLTAVDDIISNDQELLFCRSLFNGKLYLQARITGSPAVITILPGAFAFNPSNKTSKTDKIAIPDPTVVTALPLPPAAALVSDTCTPLGIDSAVGNDDTALEKADIVVAVGRGIADEENLEIVQRLARSLPNAAVAASRPLCDLKWLPYSRQVGATGKTVAPLLYLACGISGAQQHLQGMAESRCIVAINSDPQAAIFDRADYCVVEDILKFLPVLTEKLKGDDP